MLTQEDYTRLRMHLEKIAKLIPSTWGRMQSRDLDRRLPKIYEYKNYPELNEAIKQYVERGFLPNNNAENNYYRHRWFAYMCSLVDEYLFYKELENYTDVANVMFNSFKFDGALMIPDIKEKWVKWLNNPLFLIDYLYKEHRKGIRKSRKLENRFFIAYRMSDVKKEPLIRADFDLKSGMFKEYIELWVEGNCKPYVYMNGRKSDIIIITQNEADSITYGFGSENGMNELITKTV